MHLYLTKGSHLNTSYVNDNGQVLYKVATPFRLLGMVSTITCALPGDIVSASGTNNPPPDYESRGEVELRDRFVHLAEIEFNQYSSSVMKYRGEEHETSKFFRKNWYGRDRVFTGPDGMEYKWILESKVKLVRLDAARTPVARFHRRHLGIFREARRASLEIFPEGMHMIDLILVTYVYIQKKCNDVDRTSRCPPTF